MAETVAVIDYGSGNLRSAAKAVERAAADGGRKARIVVTSDPAVVAAADRLVRRASGLRRPYGGAVGDPGLERGADRGRHRPRPAVWASA